MIARDIDRHAVEIVVGTAQRAQFAATLEAQPGILKGICGKVRRAQVLRQALLEERVAHQQALLQDRPSRLGHWAALLGCMLMAAPLHLPTRSGVTRSTTG